MRLLIAVSVALVLAGCSGTTVVDPETSTTSTTPPPTTVPGDLEVVVPPGPDGELPPDLLVACPSGPMFPISALDEIVPVDLADPGIGQALTTFLEGEEGSFWPQEGWVVLHQTESEALVVTLGDEGPVFVTTTFEDEEWVWSGAQGGRPCPLEFTVPEGINSVDWRLDPARPAPDPASGTIAVILNERPCVSGQEIGDRLLGPQVVMTDTQVFIAFAAERPPGDTFDCPGNPETPFVVELPEPLGDRELIEGLQVGFDLEDYLN